MVDASGDSGARYVKDRNDLQSLLADHLEVVKELGRGGMAIVFEAVDLRSHEHVALKLLRPELVSLVERRRFLREVDFVSQLSHPGILPVLSSGETKSSLYYTMPLVDGGTLRTRLERETQLPIDDVLKLVRTIGGALDYAASRQIVHRDVKPENILLRADGSALLADFGIARAIEQAAADRLTYSQFALGTPAYMSPEQHTTSPGLDGRADQYSLAVVAYEMLAGMPPFVGATPSAILARKSLEPMPSLRAIRREIPREIERAIARALAVSPADRFASCSDFAASLSSRRAGSGYRSVAAGGVAVATLAAILWTRTPPQHHAVPENTRRVAVLPLTNATGDSSLRVVGLMAADWISEGLSRTGIVNVVPTPSVLDAAAAEAQSADQGSEELPARIGRALGADVLVTGRLYLLRDSIRVQMQVVDARLERLLGTLSTIVIDPRDPMGGVEELRTRVMGLLASVLDSNLVSTAGTSISPPTFEAYRAFSRGLEEYTRHDFNAAVRSFSDASLADTSFAVPLLFASISLSNLGDYARADSVIRRMGAHSGALSPLHQTWVEYRVQFLSGNRAAALQTVRRLAELSPGTKAVYNYAVEAYENGFYSEAIAALRTLDTQGGPMRIWPSWWDVMGSSHHLLGDVGSEAKVGDDAQRRFPSRLFARLPSVRALAAEGNFADLDRLLAAAASLPPDPYGTTLGSLLFEAAIEASAHRGGEVARPLLQRARAWFEAHDDTHVAILAELRYLLGDAEGARGILEAAALRDGTSAQDVGLLGSIYARLGNRSAAERLTARLASDTRPYQFGESRLAAARIQAALGEHEVALELLERAFSEGLSHDHWLHTMKELDGVRREPRFAAMTRAR